MSRELEFSKWVKGNFDGWWRGYVEYRCDNCGKPYRFRFDSEESAFGANEHRRILSRQGWCAVKESGVYYDFCSESCRNKYAKRFQKGEKDGW